MTGFNARRDSEIPNHHVEVFIDAEAVIENCFVLVSPGRRPFQVLEQLL